MRRQTTTCNLNPVNKTIPLSRNITKGAVVAVGFDGEQGGMIDDASVETRAVNDDFGLLVRADVDFEGRFRNLLSSVRNHDNMAAIFARVVNGFRGVLIYFAQLDGLVDATRSNDANIQLTLAGAFGVDAEVGDVADADAVWLQTATGSANATGIGDGRNADAVRTLGDRLSGEEDVDRMDAGVAGNVLAAPNFRTDLTQFDWNSIALAGWIEDDHFGNAAPSIFRENVEICRPIDGDTFWFNSRAGSRHFGGVAGVSLYFHFEWRFRNIFTVVTNLNYVNQTLIDANGIT